MSVPSAVIRLALPSKGHLYEGSLALFRAAGYAIRRPSERQYEATIAGRPRFHVVFMRPADIVEQARQGRCHLGVTGLDVYAERAFGDASTAVVSSDLGFGGCRLTVAVPESWVDVGHILDLVDLTTAFKSSGKAFRVSTKYPALVREHFRKWGIYYYEIISSDGALELHPSLGIADVIVDLTSSGSTLKDNRLREIEGGTVLDSAACLIGHADSLRALIREGESDGGELAALLDAVDGVRASEGWLHLEAVGTGGAGPSGEAAAAVARALDDAGAQHVCRGEVWDAAGAPAWRVTGLIRAADLVAARRRLVALGALRVAAVPARFVFNRDDPSTFDRLRAALMSE